jgi:dihydroorotate dehydrogenase electron transfer subunit
MWVLEFAAADIATSAKAGQFVNLGIGRGLTLRRPFSVHRCDGDRIAIVLKAVGVGTGELLEMKLGETVSCLGPLGRPFALPRHAPGKRAVLISGGLGIAPMPLVLREAHHARMLTTSVHGARTAVDLYVETAGSKVIWATDDGTQGFHGTAVEAAPDGDLVFACGPNRMLAAVAQRWPDAQVAVETYMGCGTGVCLGCAVPLARGGYDRACQEGPVYRAADVDWAALPSHLPYAITA